MDQKKLKRKKEEEINMTGAIRPNPVYCRTCFNSHGEPPWADKPDKVNCRVYMEFFKPRDVLFDGAECEFYVKEVR